MTQMLDVVVLTGQSNAVLSEDLGAKLLNENIYGTAVSGTLLQLACYEAGIDLGLGPSGVLGVTQTGSISNGSVTGAGTAYAGTALIPGSQGTSNPAWFNFINGDPNQGITNGSLEDGLNTYLQSTNSDLTNEGFSINKVATISMQNESDE